MEPPSLTLTYLSLSLSLTLSSPSAPFTLRLTVHPPSPRPRTKSTHHAVNHQIHSRPPTTETVNQTSSSKTHAISLSSSLNLTGDETSQPPSNPVTHLRSNQTHRKHLGDRGTRTGFLEIIKRCFSDPNKSNLADIFQFTPKFPGTNCNNGGKNVKVVHGVVKSVGPFSIVRFFWVQLLCCECRLRGSRDLVNNLRIGSFEIENVNGHSFTKVEILYFCGNASSFHPVMTKLIGNRVVVSGLKKKLVCLTKEESCLMYLTLDETVLRVSPRLEKLTPCLKSEIKAGSIIHALCFSPNRYWLCAAIESSIKILGFGEQEHC